MAFRIKRVYEPAKRSDGARVLVDRLWPRGIRKEDAQLTRWMKEVAPSPALRAWFHGRQGSFAEFRRRYEAELARNPAVDELRKMGKGRVVTLLYGARNPKENHAVVLLAALRTRRMRKAPSAGRRSKAG